MRYKRFRIKSKISWMIYPHFRVRNRCPAMNYVGERVWLPLEVYRVSRHRPDCSHYFLHFLLIIKCKINLHEWNKKNCDKYDYQYFSLCSRTLSVWSHSHWSISSSPRRHLQNIRMNLWKSNKLFSFFGKTIIRLHIHSKSTYPDESF